jgi:hypothetical protein
MAIPKALLSISVLPIDADNAEDPNHDVIAVPEERFPELHAVGLL